MNNSTKYWIIASILFFVGMVMALSSWFFIGTGLVLAMNAVSWLFVIAGWVMFFFGLVSRIRGD